MRASSQPTVRWHRQASSAVCANHPLLQLQRPSSSWSRAPARHHTFVGAAAAATVVAAAATTGAAGAATAAAAGASATAVAVLDDVSCAPQASLAASALLRSMSGSAARTCSSVMGCSASAMQACNGEWSVQEWCVQVTCNEANAAFCWKKKQRSSKMRAFLRCHLCTQA